MINCKCHFNIAVILLISIMLQNSYSQTTNTVAQSDYDLPAELINTMAKREMRYHHFLWHNIRNSWYKIDQQTRDEITKLGWAPPRPAFTPEGSTDRNNKSGEDFLYMHREMITMANNIMKKYGRQLTGFKNIPVPGDQTYPIPRGGRNENYASYKSDDYYWNTLLPAEKKYTDPKYLKKTTLGQLGSAMEFSIHNQLHTRYSDTAPKNRPSSPSVMPYVDKKWDDPSYTWLLDSYASHVHPIFWKIHCWIDDRIEDWKKANNVETINWEGTWTGGPNTGIQNLLDTSTTTITTSGGRALMEMHNMDEKQHKHHVCVMERVMRLLLKQNICSYYDCFLNDFKVEDSDSE